MKYFFRLLSLLSMSLLVLSPLISQSIIKSKKDIGQMRDKLSKLHSDEGLGWTKENKFQLHISEVAFINWKAGGSSSFGGIFESNFKRTRKGIGSLWDNKLTIRYGGNYVNFDQGNEAQFRKSTDLFRLESTYGLILEPNSMWYFSAKGVFTTQMSYGRKYNKNGENPITSKPLAPGYLFAGAGFEYVEKDQNFKIYFSPITEKSTFVLDETLSEQGNFGVPPGKKSQTELGILISNFIKKEIYENVTLKHQINLYSDFISDFGNIDIDWALNFDLSVNKYISATIGGHMIYDNDIKFETDPETNEPYGARIQLQQSLGVGLKYAF